MAATKGRRSPSEYTTRTAFCHGLRAFFSTHVPLGGAWDLHAGRRNQPQLHRLARPAGAASSGRDGGCCPRGLSGSGLHPFIPGAPSPGGASAISAIPTGTGTPWLNRTTTAGGGRAVRRWPSSPQWVKSNWASRPGGCTWGKYTSRSGPCRQRLAGRLVMRGNVLAALHPRLPSAKRRTEPPPWPGVHGPLRDVQ